MAKDNPIGALAFIVSLILALVLGALGSISSTMAVVLVALGLIVGLLNISGKETKDFMTAGTVLVIVSFMGTGELSMISYVSGALTGLLLVFVPATVVVAVKQMLGLAKH